MSIVPGSAGWASASITLPTNFTLVSDLNGFGEGVFNFIGSFTARASARPGDVNFDGVVNLLDFNVLASNFGTVSGGNWLAGDFTFDGVVNLNDFNALAANFGLSASGELTAGDWAALAAVVPEPASGGALAAVAFAAISRRLRRA
jgi:hypothetical protein